ncbi:uncharacterized protein LY79DRAFT_586991 [Colletotrichum navitas]|uniref:Uncharacterized protein n=1 Tax=Colletotrichum navitas TaxID=681940 RepID=A0AAD8Q9I4_9PEZI|nr:uncharacterized protein LY79DRAFT_586991 [Colletotrichum navitas]KAK1598440.1 hypothetical protein LY79DRAFT_586991 [Colletotrichum navitas]
MLLLSLVTLFASAVGASPVVLESRRAGEALEARNANTTYEQCSPFSQDGIQPGCWETLEMNKHLNDWWSANSARCNSKNKGFARCYLDTAGLITWNCDFVSLNGCTPPPSGRADEYASYQEFYVIWNIYAINLFFTNYHQALLQGQASAIGAVAEIVKVVAPPTKENPKTPLFAPIFGSTLAQFAALGPLLGSSIGASIMFASLTGTLGNTAGVYNALFPVTMVYQVSWEQLSAALSDNVNEYQKRVGEALTKIQTDFTLFYELTSNGAFSQQLSNNLPKNTDFMYHNLLKWTLNQALAQDDYFAVKNPGVDPRKIPIDQYDCSKLDEYGTCGPVWYDGKDSYGLARANDIGMDRMKDILDVAFKKNWTTPSELYIDAQSCQGKNGSEAFDVNNLSLSCVSNLPVCEFDFDYNPYEMMWLHRSPPQFKNCPSQKGWGTPPYWGIYAGVPLPYLGPFLLSGVVYDERSG